MVFTKLVHAVIVKTELGELGVYQTLVFDFWLGLTPNSTKFSLNLGLSIV